MSNEKEKHTPTPEQDIPATIIFHGTEEEMQAALSKRYIQINGTEWVRVDYLPELFKKFIAEHPEFSQHATLKAENERLRKQAEEDSAAITDLFRRLEVIYRAELFEDGVSADLHTAGVTKPSEAYMLGREDVLFILTEALRKYGIPYPHHPATNTTQQ